MTSEVPIRILLIEDSPTDADLIEIALTSVGKLAFDLTLAETLTDGLKAAASAAFEVVLLDLSLPDSYGIETCIRVHNQFPSIPIIVLTGFDDDDRALAAMKVGAQDYLVKGAIDGRGLARSIRYAIERQTAQERTRHADERLRLITEQLPAVLWTTDLQLRFTPPSTQFSLTPQHSASVEGRELVDVLGNMPQAATIVTAHRRALAGDEVSTELRLGKRSVALHVRPMRDAMGHVIGTIGFTLDISSQKRMESELNAARHVQQALFPKQPPRLAGFDIAGAVYAAEETAGDYFDFIPMPRGRWGLIVGDVVGHGLGPAMLMAELRAYLRAIAAIHDNPAVILEEANRLLTHDLDETRFVTLFFAVLDPANHEITYASAGQSAFLVRRNGSPLTLECTGLPLGLSDDEGIELGPRITLQPGDLLFMPTDGFHEAQRADKQMFGLDRTLKLIEQARDAGAETVIKQLRDAVCDFIGSSAPADDMTAIVVHMLPH